MSTPTKQPFDPKQYVQYDEPSGGGCGMGCWAFGCVGVIVMIMMMCGGGFYGLLYSSLPLKMLESAIESEGGVEIEGLKGNITSGFSADEFRFQTVDDKWSTLKDIKFKYSSGASIFRQDRLIIDEISVNGGTIYAEWDEESNELAFEPDFDPDLDIDDDFSREFGRSGIREIRVDLIRVANLKIVNTKSDVEITLDEIKYAGFHWEENNLIDLGDFLVHSSQMELDTVESLKFPGEEHAKRFEGSVKKQIDHRLTTDVPFAIDFMVDDDLKFKSHSSFFDDKVLIEYQDGKYTVSSKDFSPADFIDPKSGRILPSNYNMVMVDEDATDNDDSLQLAEPGSLVLGLTRFELAETTEVDEWKDTVILGVSSVNGKRVDLKLTLENQFSLLWRVTLFSDEFDSDNEIWAQTVFGKSFDDLPHEKQIAVIASVAAGVEPVVEKIEEVDGEATDEGDGEAESDAGDMFEEADEVEDTTDLFESDGVSDEGEDDDTGRDDG